MLRVVFFVCLVFELATSKTDLPFVIERLQHEKTRYYKVPATRRRNVNVALQLERANLTYLREANIYLYPDPPNQSRLDLLECFGKTHQQCWPGRKRCDPDNDVAARLSNKGYLAEDVAEIFIFPVGNVNDSAAKNVDLYVVNP